MKEYGIVDVGSNTIVLLLYTIDHGIPMQVYHESIPVHLIDYVDEQRHMSTLGIQAAYQVVQKYADFMKQRNVEIAFADITEPARITNLDELVSTLEKTGIPIYPLTGEQEATFDYTGSLLSVKEIKDGIAFDVGGGSTELISFHQQTVQTAMSFPLGCVRLSHLPLDTDQCAKAIQKAKQDYPTFQQEVKTLIGIGGTMRAVGVVNDAIYHTGDYITLNHLETMFNKIQQNEPIYLDAMQKCLNRDRISVLLPGLHMILEICYAFNAKEIMISKTGIREGFLLHQLEQSTL